MTYNTVIKYFLILLSMLLLSGLWMFVVHTGLSVGGTNAYYAKKSFYGLLETVSPHLFGMGVVFFILTHFFTMVKGLEKPSKWIILLFIMMLSSNLVGFFITQESSILSFIKIASTLIMIGVSFILIWKLQTFRD